MGAVQQRLVQASLASQSALGTPASVATYTVGLTGGKVYDVDLEETDMDHTWSDRILAGYDRVSAVPISDLSFYAMPKSIGLFLLQGLGARNTTGAGPYTHTFTPANALAYTTLWGKYGGSDSAKLTDAKVDSLEFEWEKTGALKAKTKLIGCAIDTSTAFPAVGATADHVSGGVFQGAGGVFQIDGATARITGGSIKISNSIETILTSDSVTPVDVFEGKVAIEISLKIKPADMTYWRKVVTGSTSGTVAAVANLIGAADIKFVGPSSSSLEFVSPAGAVAWSTSMPDANPSGGAAELTVTGRVIAPTAGTAFSAILINSVATY